MAGPRSSVHCGAGGGASDGDQRGSQPPLLRPAAALDVEFGHWRAHGREVAVPAWVAVVDEAGAVVLDARVAQEGQLPPRAMSPRDGSASCGAGHSEGSSELGGSSSRDAAGGDGGLAAAGGSSSAGGGRDDGDCGSPPAWCHVGGVAPGSCSGECTPAAALADLLRVLEGRLVVGHGVVRDMAALGMAAAPAAAGPSGLYTLSETAARAGAAAPVPAPPRAPVGTGPLAAYDTKAFPGFQGRSGAARSLAHLARKHLGRTIQAGAGPRAPQRPHAAQAAGDGSAQPQQRRRHESQRGAASEVQGGGHGSISSGSSGISPAQAGNAGRARHDAVEDARAVMDLWLRVVRPRLLLDAASAGGGTGADAAAAAYQRLVALETAALLAAHPLDADGAR